MLPKIFQDSTRLVPNSSFKATRRSFVLGAIASAAGLAVGYRMQGPAAAQAAAAPNLVEPYVAIGPDGAVTIYHRSSKWVRARISASPRW